MSNLQFTNEDYSDVMFLVYKKGVDKILKQIADENEKSDAWVMLFHFLFPIWISSILRKVKN